MQLPIDKISIAPAAEPSGREHTPFNIRSYNILNELRLSAMKCRAAARTDIFEACALLTLDGEDGKRTFIATFVTCLPTAVQKQIKWFQPGTGEHSFDEAWVMRCINAIETGDSSSIEFLLRSRVTPHERRYIGFLLGRISEQFSQV